MCQTNDRAYIETEEELRERYMNAVQNFIRVAKKDVNIIAVVVMGSLSNDVVWEKSDIDAMVVVRDQKLDVNDYTFDADGINLNMSVCTRSSFVKMLNKSEGGSIGHSFFSRAIVMYTNDASITELVEDNKAIGERDAERSVMMNACDLVCLLEKCEKWLYIKKDYEYCRYYLIHASDVIARIELCKRLEPVRRESIQRVQIICPELMKKFYAGSIEKQLTPGELAELIKAGYGYLTENIDFISRQVIEYLDDGEIRSLNEFRREFHTSGHFIVHLLDFFAESGIIDKVSKTVRLTPKSRPVFEEVAFVKLTR